MLFYLRTSLLATYYKQSTQEYCFSSRFIIFNNSVIKSDVKSCFHQTNSTQCGFGPHLPLQLFSSQYPPARAGFGVRRSRKKLNPCERHPQRRHPINRSFFRIATYLVKQKAVLNVGVHHLSQSRSRRRDKGAADRSHSRALATPKQTEKKNHTTTQILPMEEGQDVEACSANEKNVCKLATQPN